MENSEPAADEVPITIWDNCYDESWKTEITDESFAHPAKMARGLVRRIFDYLIDSGRLTKGQIVCDPFGGIGTTGIEGASRGMRCFACELEPRFVDFAKANIELHRRTWEHFGDPIPVIVQGDSRKLCEVLGPLLADVVVGSPPFANPQTHDRGHIMDEGTPAMKRCKNSNAPAGFVPTNTTGNIGGMKLGNVDAVIGSPPFLGARAGTTASTETSGGGPCAERVHTIADGDRLGTSPGQFGAMRSGSVDAVVSSPPYEGSLESWDKKSHIDDSKTSDGRPRGNSPGTQGRRTESYGQSDGQLGSETGETFWAAAREIVAQCHQILKPGGVCVWVTKDFVRNKQRVPFSADWVKLCQSQGFQFVEWIQASLVKTSESQLDLFGGEPHVKITERKSFFRRLAEKKGSPRIDWEDVLVLQKKSEQNSSGDM